MAIVRELVTLLRYQVDKSGLTEYAHKARTVGQQVSGVGRAAMTGWREGVRQALSEYGLVPGRVLQGIREQRRLNAEQRKSARNVKEIGGEYSALSGYIRAALATVGVAATAGLADEWSGVEARIGLATDSIQDQQRALKSLYASAQSAGQDYLATGDLFTSVSRNRKELGLQLDQSLQLTDTIGKLLTIGGGSAGSQQAALTQLGQALGSGVLRGDELNSILEQAPRLAQAVADSFGVSVGELRKLGQSGKLTSKQLADGLLRLGESINEEFERMPKTFGRGATLIRNAWGRMIWQVNRASAASEGFYALSKLIAQNMTEIIKIGAMALLAAGVMKLLPLLGKMRVASLAVMWPFLRMVAILESIRLVGDDVLTWMRGGRSVLGGIIGRSDEWKTQIDFVKSGLEKIKNLMGDGSKTLGEWVSKWGTVGVLAYGLLTILRAIGRPIVAVGGFLLRWLVAPVLTAIAAVIGWPIAIGIALAAILIGVYNTFDSIKKYVDGIIDSITKYFTDKWDATLKWLETTLKKVLPEGWVVSGDAAQQQRDEAGRRLNPYAGNMGALQRPQSYSPSQNNSIVNNTTINANSNNPAALANAAGQAVGRATDRIVKTRWAPPNVEAAA